MDEPSEETTDVSSGLLYENEKTHGGKADGNQGRLNDLIEADVEILRRLSTVATGHLLLCELQGAASRAPYCLESPQNKRERADGDGKRSDQQSNDEQPVTGCRAGRSRAGITA